MVQSEGTESTTPLFAITDFIPSCTRSDDLYKSTQPDCPKRLVVAISGCSSSGKTLLSLLLQAVFSDLGRSVFKPAKSLKALQSIIIHEDDYFMPKRDSPSVSFETTLADGPFILKSLCCDGLSHYHFKQHSYISDDLQDVLRQKSLPQTASAVGTVTGPDTDCWKAINISALITALENLKTGDMQRQSLRQHSRLEESKIDIERWAKSIQDMQQLVRQWAAKEYSTITPNTKRNKMGPPHLCIVEGFLLYTDPDAAELSHIMQESNPDFTYERKLAVPKYDMSGANLQAQKFGVLLTPDKTGEPSPRTRPCLGSSRDREKALMDFFDIKLFLPTSRDVAKDRRFSRRPYMDPPSGDRMAGQYWKTEGYFDSVVWPSYERFHKWLLADGKIHRQKQDGGNIEHYINEVVGSGIRYMHWKKGDIHMREVDADVEYTLRWAVGVILAEMSKQAYRYGG